jgi:hypothetical protein
MARPTPASELPLIGCCACWAETLDEVADDLWDEIEPRGQAELLRAFAGPYAARTPKLLLGLDDVSDQDMQSWSQALIDGISNCAGDAEIWRRCDQASAEIDAAIERSWPRADEGTVLHSTLGAGTLSAEEIRANIKLFHLRRAQLRWIPATSPPTLASASRWRSRGSSLVSSGTATRAGGRSAFPRQTSMWTAAHSRGHGVYVRPLDVDALVAQMHRDVEAARQLLANGAAHAEPGSHS